MFWNNVWEWMIMSYKTSKDLEKRRSRSGKIGRISEIYLPYFRMDIRNSKLKLVYLLIHLDIKCNFGVIQNCGTI